jgi:hypothetical protein
MTKNKLKTRMSNHLSNIKNNIKTNVSSHFTDPNHNVKQHFKIAIIDFASNLEVLKIREGLWINQRESVYHGLNGREESHYQMDFQVITYSRHFTHSLTCLPYTISTLKDMTIHSLKKYKRDPLKPHRTRSALSISRNVKQPHLKTGSRNGKQSTLDMYGYVKRTSQNK